MMRSRSSAVNLTCLLSSSSPAARPSHLAFRSLASHASHASHASTRNVSTSHKVIVVGAGAAGTSVSHQLLRSGSYNQDDIAIVDPSEWHNYQPGWTLVGGGLKNKADLRRPLKSLLDPKLKHYSQSVDKFQPEQNTITLANGDTLTYDNLVVVPGLSINYDAIKGLPQALNDPNSLISTIYGYDTCDKVFDTISKLKSGNAIFTQPLGVIKCAGAPQKIMWLALDHWKKAGLYNPTNPAQSPISINFATALPVMFGVPKYSAKLNELREQRGVTALFEHDLVAIENGNTAVFARPGGAESVKKQFDFLHVTPKMGALPFVKNSPLADAAGFVDVDQGTTRHKRFDNVWSIGDASSLPTSKTAAAITSQAPVLVHNLQQSIVGKPTDAIYDGYTSCPIPTEYGKLLLAEFAYGGKPKETFHSLFGIDQIEPRRSFYHLKKDFFPWVYFNNYVKGTWGGPKGWAFGNKASMSTYALPGSKRSFSSSVTVARNTPARRPRDPLDSAPNAIRHSLSSGETFIVRPPPTAGSFASTTLVPQPLLSPTPAELADDTPLPPLLKTSEKHHVYDTLSPQQIAQVQHLRAADPISNTASKLARQFNVSPLFVSQIAPAPKHIREGRKADHQLSKLSWGLRKRIAAAEREERRKLW